MPSHHIISPGASCFSGRTEGDAERRSDHSVDRARGRGWPCGGLERNGMGWNGTIRFPFPFHSIRTRRNATRPGRGGGTPVAPTASLARCPLHRHLIPFGSNHRNKLRDRDDLGSKAFRSAQWHWGAGVRERPSLDSILVRERTGFFHVRGNRSTRARPGRWGRSGRGFDSLPRCPRPPPSLENGEW